MNDKTFAEMFCAQRGLPESAYEREVLRETLYPHARVLAGFIRLISSRHFSADADFIFNVGKLRRFREFYNEAEEYSHHPENRGFWRITLSLRVSTRRMRHLVRTTLHPHVAAGLGAPDDAQSAHPFENKSASSTRAPNAESVPS
jgi:hypothetical protein